MTRLGDPTYRIRFGGRFTPAVRAIVISTASVFVVQIILASVLGQELYAKWCRDLFGLRVNGAVGRLYLWQLGTYALLHAVGNPIHILGNMFMLWMFGGQTESYMGTRRFLKLYVLGAVFAGVLTCLFYGISGLRYPGDWSTPVIGASGAVCAVLAAFATLFPNRIILVFFILPMKVKHAVLLFAAAEAIVTFSGTRSGIATIAHLGGFGFGFVFIRYGRRIQRIFLTLYERRRRQQSKRDQENTRKLRERVDDLLVKVNEKGMDSLNRRERSFLKKASKQFRRPPEQ